MAGVGGGNSALAARAKQILARLPQKGHFASCRQSSGATQTLRAATEQFRGVMFARKLTVCCSFA